MKRKFLLSQLYFQINHFTIQLNSKGRKPVKFTSFQRENFHLQQVCREAYITLQNMYYLLRERLSRVFCVC